MAKPRSNEQPAARPLASGEPATVARLLVGTFPPKEAVPRARAMLADLKRLLPRHDWERHLRAAMRSELGMEPAAWMEPPPEKPASTASKAGHGGPAAGGKKPRLTMRVVRKPPPSTPPPRVGPTKSVANLSQDLERILAQEQLAQAPPPGMEKCPVCGAAVEPTRTKKVRTHDNPLKGTRCDGSGQTKAGAARKTL